MQLLTAKCPYCGNDVETSINHTTEPVKCPQCEKPFEVKIPSAEVISVREAAAEEVQVATKPDERILHKVHPVILRARPLGTLLIITILGFSLWGLVMTLFVNEPPMVDPDSPLASMDSINWLFWLANIGLIAVIGTLLYWCIQAYATTLTLTDSRTIIQRGIVSRDTSEVQHDDVRNIQMDQTFWQRILNIGDLAISSSGQDDMEIAVTGLPAPASIVAMIRENQR